MTIITECNMILREKLIILTQLIKKIKNINYNIMKEIAKRYNKKDLYYDEYTRKIYYINNKNECSIDDIKHNTIKLLDVVNNTNNDEYIKIVSEMKPLNDVYEIDENDKICIFIYPGNTGANIIRVYVSMDLYKNFDKIINQLDLLEKKFIDVYNNNKKVYEKLTP